MKNLLFKILFFSFFGLWAGDGFSQQRSIWLQFEGPGNTRVLNVTVRYAGTSQTVAFSANSDYVILHPGQYLNQKLEIEATNFRIWQLEVLQDASLQGLNIHLIPLATTDNPQITNKLTVNSRYNIRAEHPILSERQPAGGAWSYYNYDPARSNNLFYVYIFNPQGSTESSIQLKVGINSLAHFNLHGINDDAVVDVILENGVGPKKDKN